MLVLALDTTTRTGSLALARDGIIIGDAASDPQRTHGEQLGGAIVELLGRVGVTPGEIDLYGVAVGPGSFTGLRVGIAAIQGLALVHDRLVVSVSTLDALALSLLASANTGPAAGDLVAAWIDAQRGEIFSALYQVSPKGEPLAIEAPAVASPAATLAGWTRTAGGRTVWFVGDGALAYRAVVSSLWGGPAHLVEHPRLAPVIAAVVPSRAATGHAIPPHAIRPIYVRRPDAERDRERRNASLQDFMITIERMIPERDLDGILEIESESFTNPWTREMFTWELQNSDVSYIYVLRIDEGVVAFCSCWLIFDELHINNLAVRPAFRGRGLATALLEHVLHAAAALGARRATLEVRRSNAAALRLYERRGFVVRGARRNYYTNPDEDALILWREGLR